MRILRVCAVAVLVAGLTAGCEGWVQFGNTPSNTRSTTSGGVAVTDAPMLREKLKLPTGGDITSSPAVTGGKVYAGSADGSLYAFDEATGAEAWRGPTGGAIHSSPAVANGTVFVGSFDDRLYAFDAAGATGCSGTPKSCLPLWTAPLGSDVHGSPTVAGGVVYIGADSTLYAFDAAGNTGCSGSPKTCAPLWTAPIATFTETVAAAPAVVGGVVYITSYDGLLSAFDATGTTGCAGSPKVCTPLWTAAAGYSPGTPAVSEGVVYSVGAEKLYAFDAAGNTGCSGTPKTCTPLWTGATGLGLEASPAVANGRVFVGSFNDKVYAFDATGTTGCSGTPKICTPVVLGLTGGDVASSPAVTSGLVVVGSMDDKVYGFDATCASTCAPVWTAKTGGDVVSSPAVNGGKIYIGSADNYVHVYTPITLCSGTPLACDPAWNTDSGWPVRNLSRGLRHGVMRIG